MADVCWMFYRLAGMAGWHGLSAALAAFVAVKATHANVLLGDPDKLQAVAIIVDPRVLESRSPSRMSRFSMSEL